MPQFFTGQVSLFAGNFAPQGWALCEGQLLAIAQYQELFSLLGATYGGDGRSTFALPDFRSRAGLGVGGFPPLPRTDLGSRETVNQHQGSEPQFGTLGVNHIICLNGSYPVRS